MEGDAERAEYSLELERTRAAIRDLAQQFRVDPRVVAEALRLEADTIGHVSSADEARALHAWEEGAAPVAPTEGQ